VATSSIGIDAVVDAVTDDRGHGAQERERRPETVVGRHVGAVELPRPRRPEALSRVVEVPAVEVGDLRPLDDRDPANLARVDGPGFPRADGNDEPRETPTLVAPKPIVEARSMSRALVGGTKVRPKGSHRQPL
jgi:hypothetical protein